MLIDEYNWGCTDHAQEAPGGQAMPQAEDVSMDHDCHEASSGESVPSIQPEPILAVRGIPFWTPYAWSEFLTLQPASLRLQGNTLSWGRELHSNIKPTRSVQPIDVMPAGDR